MGQDQVNGGDIVELFGNFYDQQRSSSKDRFEIGEIVYVPVSEIVKRPWIADALRHNAYTHDKAFFHVRPLDDRLDFKPKDNRLPLKALNLDESHELIISRAKKRPCLVVGRVDGGLAASIGDQRQANKALNAFIGSHLLAPMFSVSTPDKQRAFGPIMTARVRHLMYPEFFFMPRSGGVIRNDSVLRIDYLFANPLVAGVEHENLFVSTKILSLIYEQINIVLGKRPSNEYLETRQLLMEFLPDSAKPAEV